MYKKLKEKKTIGILGGMGPNASANFYFKIIEIAQNEYGAEQDTDFPPMLIYSLPLVGFDETGFTNLELVKSQLIDGVKKLESAGCDFIIIACNTVHYFYNEMQSAINIPILSIIDETVELVKHNNYKTVGVLSSESTNKLGLYQEALKTNNIKEINVDDEQQKIINDVILKVMSGKNGQAETNNIKIIINNLVLAGAEAIVIGCTELPLAISQLDVKIPVFDTVKIITNKAIKNSLEV